MSCASCFDLLLFFFRTERLKDPVYDSQPSSKGLNLYSLFIWGENKVSNRTDIQWTSRTVLRSRLVSRARTLNVVEDDFTTAVRFTVPKTGDNKPQKIVSGNFD